MKDGFVVAEAGMPRKYTRQRLGHKDISVTFVGFGAAHLACGMIPAGSLASINNKRLSRELIIKLSTQPLSSYFRNFSSQS